MNAPTKFITAGVHRIEAEAYHADPAPLPSLSATLAKVITSKSPLHAWHACRRLNPDFRPVERKTFDIGTAAHRAVLGRGSDYVEIPAAMLAVNTRPERGQWHPLPKVLSLNPVGRKQTRKYRATLPIARQFAPHLDSVCGPYVSVESVDSAWDSMAATIKLPKGGQAGTKLIRRSVSQIARKRLGEEHWVQGRMFLGHHKTSTSDLYALFDPANLGRALAVTEAIIDEIEALCPGAFCDSHGTVVSLDARRKA